MSGLTGKYITYEQRVLRSDMLRIKNKKRYHEKMYHELDMKQIVLQEKIDKLLSQNLIDIKECDGENKK